MDGSSHDWFEGRGSKIDDAYLWDDATGRVSGRFYEYEGTTPAMDSFRCYIKKYGIPTSVYLDKHSTYKSTAKPSIEDELNDREPLSEFERAIKELGVKVIHANSPQAKGRVERLFRTLQDRMIKEMRLMGISTIEEANKFLEGYLPIYNEKFSIMPKEEDNLHREIPKGTRLDNILCIKAERVLRNDFTIAYNNKLYQIKDGTRAKKVIVIERIDVSMAIMHKEANLRYKEIKKRPDKVQGESEVVEVRETYIPPIDHPWRGFRIGKDTKHKVEEQTGVQP